MRDAIDFEQLGLPSAVVIADALYGPADAMRRLSGLPDYPLVVTEFPVGSCTRDEIEHRAAALAADVVRALTERKPMPAAPALTSQSESYVDEDAALEAFFARGWTDGLPVVLPTPARVAALIDAAGGDQARPVFDIPSRPGLVATVRDVAVNAVMAGASASLFPLVLAVCDAMNEPAYNLHAHTGTMAGAQQLIVVNGPQRSGLGLRTGNGGLGPGWRANATVGRAVRLTIRNVLRSVPDEFDRAGFSHPGRYSWCIAEAEEQSPWPSLAQQSSSIVPGSNSVSVYATVWQSSIINHELRARPIVDELALVARTGMHANWLHRDVASDSSFYPRRPFLFITGHEHARILVRDGFADLASLRGALFERLTEPHPVLRPAAIASPANIYVAYLHATGMQQTQFFAPFQSHNLVTRQVP